MSNLADVMQEIESFDLAPGQGIMAAMDASGDLKITWNRDEPDTVAAARKTFNELVKDKRYVAYSVTKGGERNEIVREFNPDAERIILAPPMVGG